jgi:hypothetical protein
MTKPFRIFSTLALATLGTAALHGCGDDTCEEAKTCIDFSVPDGSDDASSGAGGGSAGGAGGAGGAGSGGRATTGGAGGGGAGGLGGAGTGGDSSGGQSGAGGGGAGGSDGGVPDAGDAAPDGPPPCDGTQSPSEDSCVLTEEFGVFVSPTGSDATGDGSRSLP